MILGASYSQIPLIRAARNLGWETVAVSIPGPYAGMQEADITVPADITKPEEVLKAAKELKIDGITTCCMDLGIHAQGYVCEKLGLPGPDEFAAKASCDKSLEKEAYVQAGILTAPFVKVHSEEEVRQKLGGLRLPVMLKAADQMGSRGVYRADTEEEAVARFREAITWTGRDFCIMEECIQGTMFGIEAMISGGKPAYVLPLGNVQRDGNPPFPVGHYVPWERGEEVEQKAVKLVEQVAKALHFDNCAMDMDCMYLDGEIYVIEATARAGATCITDTVGIYYGIDYFEAIARAAMGEDVSYMFRLKPGQKGTANLSRMLSADREGIVDRIEVDGELPDNVTDLSFNIESGSRVRPMQNGRDRIGQLIVKGRDLAECAHTQEEVLGKIRLIYREENGLEK